MTAVREKFIKAVERLPYNIDEEVLKKDTIEILKDVTKKYVEIYGTDELSENDKGFIKSVLENDV